MMNKTFYLILFFGLMVSFGSLAQNGGLNYSEDANKAAVEKEKYVLYTDSYRAKNYDGAMGPLTWLLNNSPELYEGLYINGVKIYNKILPKETDAARKKVIQDSILTLYDLRLKYYPESIDKIVNDKAFYAYKFLKGDQSRYQELFELFQKTYELNDAKAMAPNNLVSYIDVVRRYKKTGGDITDEQALEIYDQVSAIIAEKKELPGANTKFLDRSQETIDKMLPEIVEVDCDFVQNNLGPKLEANPDDYKMALFIVKLARAGDCRDIPIALTATKKVHEQEPQFGWALLIANKCKQMKDYECALEYYTDALELADTNEKKGDVYIQMAAIASSRGNKATARTLALKAVSNDPSKREAYKLIGDLYFGSYEQCRGGKNKVDDRGVFLAAYQMYQKAGNSKAMQNAKNQFPSVEELFEQNLEAGQSYTVGCWINETVTLKTRD